MSTVKGLRENIARDIGDPRAGNPYSQYGTGSSKRHFSIYLTVQTLAPLTTKS
ncbi:hypothetical protein [Brucella sp. LJL56]